MANRAPVPDSQALAAFDDHALAIASRQYFQNGDEDLIGMFQRVARWVASPEAADARSEHAQRYFDLMISKRFCPGGRVLAGAATKHGNVLNCFVQDGRPETEGSDPWVLRLAAKLAVVTKVGGGNGLCLDPIAPKRAFPGHVGQLYLTIAPTHPDYDKVKDGTFMDLVHGTYVTRGYRAGRFVEYHAAPSDVHVKQVGDSVESIWQCASDVVTTLLRGEDLLLDLSELRPEGTPVHGSGGTSSGPSSFAVEVFDNFARWAQLGGAEYAGPVAALRYVFSPTLRVIRQGGCLHPDTLVHTSRGTLRLSEVVDAHQMGWQDHRLKVATDEGWKDSPRGFNNGNAPTLRVTLANGQTLRGTPRHRVKVLRQDGRREWVRLEDLQAGDHVIQVLDQHTGAPVVLRPVDVPHHNATPIAMPEVLSERLAFFLGYLWGDGFVSDGRVGLAVAHGSPMVDEAPRLFAELFGLEVAREQKVGDASVVFVTKAAHLIAWLDANGLSKAKARELRLPKAIRMAPRPVVGAFLRGLFEADGSLSHGMPSLSTASVVLAEDVATMLAGLGIPTKSRVVGSRLDRYSRHAIHHLRVVSAKGLARFVERVGAMPGSRLEAMGYHVPDEGREQSWAQVRGDRHLTATAYDRLRSVPAVAERLPEFAYDEYYVPVRAVEDAGRSLTLDLSVDENETYLAGGFVTHNTRRGAGMATMSITHADIRDFITAKDLERERTEGDISTFNISVLVSDEFMRSAALEGPAGVLHDIAEHAWQTGEPGIIYVDRINAHNPMRASLGDIKATNPCFAADTRIATSRGLVTIGELFETQENLFVVTDRRTYLDQPGVMPRAAAKVFKTSESARVYRLRTRHGYEVRATPDHKFLTPDGWVKLQDLVPGSKLLIQSAEGSWSDQYELPAHVRVAQAELVATAGSNNRGGLASRTGRNDIRARFSSLPTHWSREFGVFLGLLSGDGFSGAQEGGITFAKADLADLEPLVETFRGWFGGTVQEHANCVQWRFGRVAVGFLAALGIDQAEAAEKGVPEAVFAAPREAVIGYLQGLFTADGTVNVSCGGESCTIRLASSSRTLLADVQLLLSNLGIVSRVYHRRSSGEKLTPDGKGGMRMDAYAEQFELTLDEVDLDVFVDTVGFLTSGKQERARAYVASKLRPSYRGSYETEVVSVEYEGLEPVFDTTEPVSHSVIANAIVAHQCGEIPLFPGEPCDLGAINLAEYVVEQGVGLFGFDMETFRADVHTCVRFLDNVLEVNKFALEDNREMSHYLRRLGLGIMGLADALIRMGFRYDSEEGRDATRAMIEALREAATEASRALAEERGPFPGLGESSLADARRNIALLTVAPTGTTSMLMGVSSGVEPVFAPFIYRKIGSGYAAIIAPLFRELLERHAPHPDYTKEGRWDWQKVVEQVQAHHGSVQRLDFIPDDVKAVLVCAHDIAPSDHVRMQGVVQSAFDAGGDMVSNSISKTINLPNGAGVEDVYDSYALAFETGCKGITVYRDGSREFQVLSTSSKAERKGGAEKMTPETPTVNAAATEGAPAAATQSAADSAAAAEQPASVPPRTAATKSQEQNRSRTTFERLPSEPLFDRPTRLEGFTDAVKLMLASGEHRGFYVTVNKQDGLPVECFITSGKAGDEANADSEALGRVVSIALQYGVPAEAIVKTLRGINGGMYGTYQGRMVASRADLIAVALETAGVENVLQRGRPCPDCSAPLRFEEGCMKCEACGYSKCG